MSEVELQDAILNHAIELQRLSAHQEAEAEAILRQLERELKTLLQSRTLSEASKRDISALIKQAEQAIDSRYAAVAGSIDTHAIAIVVADKTIAALDAIIPARIIPLGLETLASAKDIMIDGAPSSAWWARQAEDTAFKFAAQVRQGVINGETNERIVQRIVGKGGEPGIMDVARRNARTLVHSSIMTAANQARLASYRKNFRSALGIKWLATLDSHTCVQCASLDGASWDM